MIVPDPFRFVQGLKQYRNALLTEDIEEDGNKDDLNSTEDVGCM